jgi:hypothetical protein
MSSYENEAPSGEFRDDSYVSRSGHKNEPLAVQSDNDRVEDPINADKADSDAQLGKSLISIYAVFKTHCVNTTLGNVIPHLKDL